MEDIRESVYVVGHDAHVEFVTTNKGLAEKVRTRKMGESPYLAWAVRTVENAIIHAYGSGLKDGEMNR